MKVLLCQDVEKLGWYGDIVEVKDGYARNYLIPHHVAVVPTEKKINDMAEEKARRSETRKLAHEQKVSAAAAVNGAEAVISAKVNEQGYLFGSVTEAMIAENLRLQGFEVADKTVKLSEHIKEPGEYEVALKFSAEVDAVVKVTVVPEGQIEETADDTADQETDEQ